MAEQNVVKTRLYHELKEVISDRIHKAKCTVKHEDFPMPIWQAVDSAKIAEEAMNEIVDHIEAWLFLPCCHTSGMHDPNHFEDGTYICDDQKAEAYERFCKDLGVDPVVRSKPGCGWCAEYPYKRKGEGKKLSENKKS